MKKEMEPKTSEVEKLRMWPRMGGGHEKGGGNEEEKCEIVNDM